MNANAWGGNRSEIRMVEGGMGRQDIGIISKERNMLKRVEFMDILPTILGPNKIKKSTRVEILKEVKRCTKH
jgi:hypothetical protein